MALILLDFHLAGMVSWPLPANHGAAFKCRFSFLGQSVEAPQVYLQQSAFVTMRTFDIRNMWRSPTAWCIEAAGNKTLCFGAIY